MVKKLCWHSTFGDIEVTEPQFREGTRRRRPFAQSAQVEHRGCSLPLQRVLTDLGRICRSRKPLTNCKSMMVWRCRRARSAR
jgi:hypothetical protein